jgi:hypothetical protein
MNLLNMNHPHGTLQNVLTFMWCIWKSRNDCLFDRKKGEPYQINLNAQAIHNNLETVDTFEAVLQVQPNLHGQQKTTATPAQRTTLQTLQGQDTCQHAHALVAVPEQGITLRSDLLVTGAKMFADASWKCNKVPNFPGFETGIGVFLQYKAGNQEFCVMVQASTSVTTSVLQAEAKALLLAARLADLLRIHRPTFPTDNLSLAKIATSKTINHALLHWDSRHILADFFNTTSRLHAQVFHIRRDLNGVAHNCAHQVLRQDLRQPIFSCVCSAHATCPAISILQNSVRQDFVIHVVLYN